MALKAVIWRCTSATMDEALCELSACTIHNGGHFVLPAATITPVQEPAAPQACLQCMLHRLHARVGVRVIGF